MEHIFTFVMALHKNFCIYFRTMATPKQPIPANLKPSPLNIQSSRSSSTTPSKNNFAAQSTPKRPILANLKPSPLNVKSTNSSSGLVQDKQKRNLPTNRHDLTLSGCTRKKLREEQDAAYLEHPYTLKLRRRKAKLQEMLHKIFELAQTDILICDRETGLNDYSKNLKFADELDDISKHLVGLSQECTNKAAQIRQRIDDAKEDKRQLQDVVYLHEVIKDTEKDDFVKGRGKTPTRFVKTSEFCVKRECVYFVDDPGATEEEIRQDQQTVYSSNPDTKFSYPKENENDELQHVDHICVECDKTLRDSQELRNHLSSHHNEIFRCMICNNKFRTEDGFNKHYKTHTGERYPCVACTAVFPLKSTLTNHMFTHTEDRMICKKCGCAFKFRSSYLEHIRYRHLDTKTIECPICHKMYWTPTSMRSHKYKKHGSVAALVYGEK